MELNWTTFVLEIINFLILVWILKRFLYKPVLNIIARRRAGIEQTLTDARELHTEAEALREQYENRLRDWERERQQARDQLQSEIDERRAHLTQKLDASLEAARQKAAVSEQRRLQDIINQGETEALHQGAQFAARLLQKVAGPEMEIRLLQLAIEDMAALPAEYLQALRASWGETPQEIHISSAYPLAESQQQVLERALEALTQNRLPCRYQEESELLAGLRISIGAWVLDLNLREELRGFTELSHTGLSHTALGHEG